MTRASAVLAALPADHWLSELTLMRVGPIRQRVALREALADLIAVGAVEASRVVHTGISREMRIYRRVSV